MKRILPLLLFILLLTNCSDSTKWWGEHLVSEISWDNGYIEKFTYDENNRLIHYSFMQPADSAKYIKEDKVFYDVNIEYSDTLVEIKGIMPFENSEISDYQYGISKYKLNENGLAVSAHSSYPNDTSGFKFTNFDVFYYKENQLSSIEVNNNERTLKYEGNNPDYPYRENPSGFTLVSTYINYTKKINKTGIIEPYNEFTGQHRPAFYAKILGRPTKNLIDTHAISYGGGQVVYNYDYVFDPEGYVTELTESSSSNLRIFGGDLFGKRIVKTITYI